MEPVWTPDGQRIVYTSQEKGGVLNLWWIRSDGAGDAQRLTESKSPQYARSWRPDGKLLAFHQLNPGTNWDIMTLPIEGNEKSGWKPGEPKPFVNSAFLEREPAFSPDGRWLAYHSNESGNYEVYVRPFPAREASGKFPQEAVSSPSGRATARSFFIVPWTARSWWSPTLLPATPSAPISRSSGRPASSPTAGLTYNFDLHPDGKRFAVLKAIGIQNRTAAVNKINFVFNFFDEVSRKFPPGK